MKNEAYAVYQSICKFDLDLRGTKYVFTCDHKPLELFLFWGITKPKLIRWSMELADYNIAFVHITGENKILADAISRLKILNI